MWGPFVGFLGQHRALEMMGFVVLYKLAENLTMSLTRPFLVQAGFNDVDVGVATATIGQVSMIVGTMAGGILTDRIGLGRALWAFGLVQLVANLGYAVVAQVGVNRPVMYSAQAVEYLTSGLAGGALGVLLLRLTQKRFSATQYALLSSLFSLPRILAGPVAGVLADTIGWRNFFLSTVLFGIPGMLMLARFVPWRARDVSFELRAPARGAALSRGALVARSALGGLVGLAAGLAGVGLVGGLSGLRAHRGFAAIPAIVSVLQPSRIADWTTAIGLAVLAAARRARDRRHPGRTARAARAARNDGVGELSRKNTRAPAVTWDGTSGAEAVSNEANGSP